MFCQKQRLILRTTNQLFQFAENVKGCYFLYLDYKYGFILTNSRASKTALHILRVKIKAIHYNFYLKPFFFDIELSTILQNTGRVPCVLNFLTSVQWANFIRFWIHYLLFQAYNFVADVFLIINLIIFRNGSKTPYLSYIHRMTIWKCKILVNNLASWSDTLF